MTTYALKTPISVDDQTYSELTFRNVRFGDYEALYAATNEAAAMRILLARLAGVDTAVIDCLDLVDVASIMDVVSNKFGPLVAKLKQ